MNTMGPNDTDLYKGNKSLFDTLASVDVDVSAGTGETTPGDVNIGLNTVQMGHGFKPVFIRNEEVAKVSYGRGINGLEDAKLAVASETEFGRRLEVISMVELQHRVLTMCSPNVQERWYAEVYMNSQKGDFLVDSGATTSMITKDFYDSLSDKPPIIPTKLMVQVADGRSICCRGLVVIPVNIAGRRYAARFLVMDQLCGKEDGIIGMDFVFPYRENVIGGRRCLSLDESREQGTGSQNIGKQCI